MFREREGEKETLTNMFVITIIVGERQFEVFGHQLLDLELVPHSTSCSHQFRLGNQLEISLAALVFHDVDGYESWTCRQRGRLDPDFGDTFLFLHF